MMKGPGVAIELALLRQKACPCVPGETCLGVQVIALQSEDGTKKHEDTRVREVSLAQHDGFMHGLGTVFR